MEDKKKIIIIVSILLAYFALMMIFFGLDNLKKKVYHVDFVISPSSYLRYEKGTWSDIKKEESELLGKSYKIYNNHQFLYEGILQYTDGNWYAFNHENKPLSLPNNFLAYRGNMKIEMISYPTMTMSENEKTEASTILKQHNIDFEPEFTKTLKIELDLNNDQKLESIYIISNTLGMEEQKTYFSIAYIKNSDNIEVLVEDVGDDMYQIPSLNLKAILDMNQDKKYELIFEKIYFDQIGTCHEIFEYVDNTYKSVKACELIERGDEEE